MKNSIPAQDELGYSYPDTYKYVYKILFCKVDILLSHFNDKSINDINGYISYYAKKIVQLCYSLYKVINVVQDYELSYAMLRMIVDRIATLNLIYNNPNKEEIIFRHYLFVLDGAQNRDRTMNKSIINNESISADEFEDLKHMGDDSISSTNDSIDCCKEAL